LAALVAVALGVGGQAMVDHPPPVHASGPTPGIITTYAGGGLGSGVATLVTQRPRAVAVNSGGTTLYIADDTTNLVRALDLASGTESVVAGSGVAGSTGDGGQATAAEIQAPTGLALDSGGNLYIATTGYPANDPNNRIRKVTPGGVISTVAGGGASLADGVQATTAALYQPRGVATDAAGNVFIADSLHDVVRKVDHSTGLIATVAGNGTTGPAGDGGLATSAQLHGPEDVVVDGAGNLFIADAGNFRIRSVDHVSSIITTVVGNGNIGPGSTCPSGSGTSIAILGSAGIALDGGGNPILESNNCVLGAVGGGNFGSLAGNGQYGNAAPPGVLGDGGPATSALLAMPQGAVMDGAGNIYIADYYDMRVRRVDASTHIITTIAGTGGVCGRSGDGGQAAAASMCGPNPLALDAAGDLFVADVSWDIVRKVDPSGVITTVAGNGTRGSSGDGGPATSAQLFLPEALATDASGNLYISDTGNNVVRRVDHQTGVITRFAGNGGNCQYSGDGGPANGPFACLGSPGGLAFDAGGNLLIGDGPIRVVSPGGVITTMSVPLNGIGVNEIATDSSGDVFAIAGNGTSVWKLTSSSAVSLASSLPFAAVGIAVGPHGQAVITASDCRVHVVTPSGLATLAGNGVCGYLSGDGGPAIAAGMGITAGVAIDSTGDIFFVDTGFARVRRIQAYQAPSTPASVNAVARDAQATVAWSALASNGGLPITQYAVRTHRGTSTSVLNVNGAPAATSAVVGGLFDHTTYTFTVSASNAWDTSADSAPSAPVMPTISDGHITTYAGAPGNGPGLSMGQAPFSLGSDAGNQLYIGDGVNPVVRSLDTTTGQEGTLAGNDANGYSGDGGSPTAASMQGAGAVVTCGPAGPTYVADSTNYRIRLVSPGGTITTVVGTGVPGYSGDGGPATAAQIGRVFGLACAGPNANNAALYIADTDNGAIRALDMSGNISTLWYGLAFPTGVAVIDSNTIDVADAGTGLIWRLDQVNGPCVMAGTGAAAYDCGGGPAFNTKLNSPWGLAWDGIWLYVADLGNNRVRTVDSFGNTSVLAGSGTPGFSGDGGQASAAQLSSPTGLVYSFNATSLYIADYSNNRVRRVDLNTHVITTVAGNGTVSLFGDGGAATSAQLGTPYAVAVDSAGNELVVDNGDNAIRKIDPAGNITTVAGTGVAGYSGDSGLATSARLNDPRGVAVSSQGDIYISDTGNNVVRRVDHATQVITTFAGNGHAGFSGDGGLAVGAMINLPRAVAVDASGNVYIADTVNNRVRKVTGTTITTVAGSGVAGYSGDGRSATSAQLNGPRGVAVNAAGDLFIGDSGNNRVRKVSAGIIITDVGTGIAGSAGDGGSATAAQLNFPFGLAFDGGGNLFIADSLNQRIRVVTGGGVISTVAGFCSPGYAGDGGVATLADLNVPYGVAVDGYGNVLVADAANNRVRGARGLMTLTGLRAAACPGPSGQPAARGANQSPAGSPPSTRIFDQGGGTRIAAVRPPSTNVTGKPTLAPHAISPKPSAAGTAKAESPASGDTRVARLRPIGLGRGPATGPTDAFVAPAQRAVGGMSRTEPGEAQSRRLLAWLAAATALSMAVLWARRRRARSPARPRPMFK
jgi:sugar lactone lactonase YvrE